MFSHFFYRTPKDKREICDYLTRSYFKNFISNNISFLTLSWRRPLSYRNQSIDLGSKSMDWFLYDNGLRHDRVMYEKI